MAVQLGLGGNASSGAQIRDLRHGELGIGHGAWGIVKYDRDLLTGSQKPGFFTERRVTARSFGKNPVSCLECISPGFFRRACLTDAFKHNPKCITPH